MSREIIITKQIDKLIDKIPKYPLRREAYVHLHGVAECARLIAYKRGLDHELLSVAGMLHDIYAYSSEQQKDHARLSSEQAKKILKQSDLFKKKEIDKICTAILYHSDKTKKHSKFDEALKDADVLHHFVMEPWKDVAKRKDKRLKKLKREFSLET